MWLLHQPALILIALCCSGWLQWLDQQQATNKDVQYCVSCGDPCASVWRHCQEVIQQHQFQQGKTLSWKFVGPEQCVQFWQLVVACQQDMYLSFSARHPHVHVQQPVPMAVQSGEVEAACCLSTTADIGFACGLQTVRNALPSGR